MILFDNDWDSLDTIELPQADDLNKVYIIVNSIYKNPDLSKDDANLASVMNITERQVRYYKSAARILGFLDGDRITHNGMTLIRQAGSMDVLVTAFQYSHIGILWSAYYRVSSVLDVPLGENEVMEFLNYAFQGRLSDSTKRRRAKTLIKWVNEYKEHIKTR